MGGHEGLDPTEEFSAHKDGGEWVAGFAGKPVEDRVDGGAGGVLVELDDGGANAEAEEEALGDGGHAAVGGAEHHYGVAGCKVAHHLVRAHH